MEFKLYYQMLKRGWKIILVTTLIAVAISLLISYMITPQYRAVARFIITPSASDVTQPSTVLEGLRTLDNQSVLATYVEVMNSDRVYKDALAFLQLKPEQVGEYSHTSQSVSNSSVMELSVIGPDPSLAARIANSIGNQTINFLRSNNQVLTINFLDAATVPTEPYSPQPMVNAVLALLLGLVGGALLVILREQLLLTLEVFRQSLRIDSDTGVYNKKYFNRRLEDQLFRNPEETLSIGILQLMFFDQDNDVIESYPVAVLQKALRQTTDLLRNELRGNDFISRWDETSFAIMLPNTNSAAAARIFNRIHQSLENNVDIGQFGLNINLRAFIGAAEKEGDISSEDLIENSLSALNIARRDTKTPVYVWETKKDVQASRSTEPA